MKKDDINEMIHDTCGVANIDVRNNDSRNNKEPNVHAKKFYKLLEDAEIEL